MLYKLSQSPIFRFLRSPEYCLHDFCFVSNYRLPSMMVHTRYENVSPTFQVRYESVALQSLFYFTDFKRFMEEIWR